MKILDLVYTLAMAQVAALQLISDYPSVPKLRRTKFNDNEGWSKDKDTLDIHFNIWTRRYGWTSTCGLTVTNCNSDPKLYLIGTSEFIYSAPHIGSAGIGITLFGMPTIILMCIPVWIYKSVLSMFEAKWGMSYRSRKVLKRLKTQLATEEYLVLQQALKTWDSSRR